MERIASGFRLVVALIVWLVVWLVVSAPIAVFGGFACHSWFNWNYAVTTHVIYFVTVAITFCVGLHKAFAND